ncbi:PEP_CTERM-anchored TLD domain-containing protein [Rugamonas apoptosis]|uniref:PEP_CTERM-anchored TLD domain-containing protein n=1 Tax=Rugamonas apoptosis TaxID=2758570 RepID=A0A7W2IMS2_9BURK|nr:PEP_CTERM-anchored TLD domain-containing protein [Rugamonas apoptosis]MBA5690075.1 PEP_CTERM-anchored TLD domain-containing protein [Rugamonas apoptosis]
MKTRFRNIAVLLLTMLLDAHASAATSLLSTENEHQLAAWLGRGSIAFNNIYTKALGDTALDFHRAVDGKGATFSVMEASNGSGQTWLIGGYNPQSWQSTGGYNMTYDNAARTSFLFNLTRSEIHRQTPQSPIYDTVGAYQAYNGANMGPTFGIGRDLFVPYNLTTNGVSLLYSYIDPAVGNFYTSILDGGPYTGPNVTFGAIQVFTISAVPEPASALMLVAGLGLMAAVRRRQARAPGM